MTILQIDGFDTYNGTGNNNGLGTRWTYSRFNNNDASVSLVAGRFGGQALRLAYSYPATAAGGVTRSLPGKLGTVGAGFAYRSSAIPYHADGIVPTIYALRNMAEGVWHVLVAVTNTGAIAVYRASGAVSGTLLGKTADGLIRSNVYHYIEVGVVIDDTAGSVRVKVDGALALTLANIDTRNGGTTATADSIAFAGNIANSGGVSHDFDDFYVTDTLMTLGERRIETLVPTADVAKAFVPSAGTVNYAMVDELPNNGATDYVSGSAAGDTDTYAFSDLTGTPAAIDAIQVVAYAQKTDAATRGIALQLKSGAATSDGDIFNLASGYSKFERIVASDPASGGAWTTASVNALQGGPKVAV